MADRETYAQLCCDPLVLGFEHFPNTAPKKGSTYLGGIVAGVFEGGDHIGVDVFVRFTDRASLKRAEAQAEAEARSATAQSDQRTSSGEK